MTNLSRTTSSTSSSFAATVQNPAQSQGGAAMPAPRLRQSSESLASNGASASASNAAQKKNSSRLDRILVALRVRPKLSDIGAPKLSNTQLRHLELKAKIVESRLSAQEQDVMDALITRYEELIGTEQRLEKIEDSMRKGSAESRVYKAHEMTLLQNKIGILLGKISRLELDLSSLEANRPADNSWMQDAGAIGDEAQETSSAEILKPIFNRSQEDWALLSAQYQTELADGKRRMDELKQALSSISSFELAFHHEARETRRELQKELKLLKVKLEPVKLNLAIARTKSGLGSFLLDDAPINSRTSSLPADIEDTRL